MRRAHTIIPLLVALAAPLIPGAAAAQDRAVVVGIDDYEGVVLPRPLTQAALDATRFRDHLIADQGFAPENVTLLVNAAATSQGILDAVADTLVAGTRAGDRVVFYFAGLGGRIGDPQGDELDQYEEYLLAHGDGEPFALIPEDTIIELFDRIPDREVTLVIDAAMTAPRSSVFQEGDRLAPRSAEFGRMSDADRSVDNGDIGPVGEASFREPPFGTGEALRDVWTATAPSQVAWETPGGGVFTTALINGIARGLADMNGNGVITNAELLTYLREISQGWCASVPTCDATGLGLTPDFSGDVLGVAALRDGEEPQTAAAVPSADDGASAEDSSEDAGADPQIAVTPPAGSETPLTIPPQPQIPEAPLARADLDDTGAFLTDLFAARNDAGLEVTMSPGGVLRLDQTVRFVVESERPGTLLLLDVNPEGELFQIFPSRLSRPDAARIEANASVMIPEAVGSTGRPLQIRVIEPLGSGFLLALLVESEAPVYEALLPQNLNLDPIPNASQFLFDLVQSLLKLQTNPNGNTAVEWSATVLPYTIVE